MFFSYKPLEWHYLAQSLGLVPYQRSVTYNFGASFRELKQSLGAPAAGLEPSFAQWLYGTYQNHEALVLTYDTGSGSTTTTWTGAIARIDPSLLLGLCVEPEILWGSLFHGQDIEVGHPQADKKLRIEGCDPVRISQLLSPADPQGRNLLDYLAELGRDYDIRLFDSYAVVALERIRTQPEVVSTLLQSAVGIASILRTRKAMLAESAGEKSQRQQWWQYCKSAAAAFDPVRMKLSGTRYGIGYEVGLETVRQQFCTYVIITLPQSLGFSVSFRKTSMPQFLQSMLTYDIKVGESAFDRCYLIEGSPTEQIRAVFGQPGPRNVINHLMTQTGEVLIRQNRLIFRVLGVSHTASEINQLVEMSCQLGRQLMPPMQPTGPYR